MNSINRKLSKLIEIDAISLQETSLESSMFYWIHKFLAIHLIKVLVRKANTFRTRPGKFSVRSRGMVYYFSNIMMLCLNYQIYYHCTRLVLNINWISIWLNRIQINFTPHKAITPIFSSTVWDAHNSIILSTSLKTSFNAAKFE